MQDTKTQLDNCLKDELFSRLTITNQEEAQKAFDSIMQATKDYIIKEKQSIDRDYDLFGNTLSPENMTVRALSDAIKYANNTNSELVEHCLQYARVFSLQGTRPMEESVERKIWALYQRHLEASNSFLDKYIDTIQRLDARDCKYN